jgi:hypothetical protein
MTRLLLPHRQVFETVSRKVTAWMLALTVLSSVGIENWGLNVPKAEAATGINRTINYQGKVALTAGTAVSNGSYNMRFKIFNAATNGTQLWAETWNSGSSQVTMTGGLFSVALGTYVSMTGSVDFNSDSLYLQVEFDPSNAGTYPEVFSPRRRFASVPYAFNAEKVGGIGPNQFLRSDQASTASGKLTIKNAGVGLNITGIGSGKILSAQDSLTSSGKLVIKGATTLQNYVSCGVITTDASGNLGCSTALSTSTGALQIAFDKRYVNTSGDTMTGGLLIQNGGTPGTIKAGHLLEFKGAASGASLTIMSNLASSGTLVVNNGVTFKSLTSCTNLQTASNGALSCNNAVYLASSTGSLKTFFDGLYFRTSTGALQSRFDNRYVNTSGDTMTGGLMIVNGGHTLTSPDPGILLEVAGTMSGRRLSLLTSQLSRTGALYVSLSVAGTGAYLTNTGSSAPVLVLNNYSQQGRAAHIVFGYRGSFDTNLYRSATRTLSTDGSFSIGETAYVRGLISCTSLQTTSSGALQCGTATAGSSVGTGSLQAAFDRRYVNVSGDTMTGGLLIQSGGTPGIIDAGLLLEIAGTASGRVLHAQDTLSSSGMLVVRKAGSTAPTLFANGTTGYVGIGTAAPERSLHILTLTTNDGIEVEQVSDSVDEGVLYMQKARGTPASKVIVQNGDGLGRINFGGYNGSLQYTPAAEISVAVDGTPGGVDMPGRIVFSTTLDGTITAVERMRLNNAGNLGIGTNNPGSRLSVSGAVIISRLGTLAGAVADPTVALEIIGTASGRVLRAQDALASSGTLVVTGTVNFKNLVNCDTIDTDANGRLVCGTDAAGGGGLAISDGDIRYVKKAGDTMTGGLLIQNGTVHGALPAIDAGLLLEVAGTASGRVLKAMDTLASSGVLSVRGATFLQSTVYARNLVSCATLQTTSSGALQCGAAGSTGMTFGTGSLTNGFDKRYVNASGDTMTGGLLIVSTAHSPASIKAGLLLEIGGTMSGSDIFAQKSLRSSGTLVVRTGSAAPALSVNAFTGRVGIGTATPGAALEIIGALALSGSTMATFLTPTNVPIPTKINVPVFDPGAFGQIFAFGLPSTAATTARAITALDARTVNHQPTIMVLSPDEQQFIGLTWDNSTSLAGYLKSTKGLGFRVNNNGAASLYIDTTGNVGISPSGTFDFANVPKAALEVIGTASGSDLYASKSLRSSGTLVVQNGVTFKGLVSCAALQTSSNGALSCNNAVYLATSTGSLKTFFDANYFRTSTGALRNSFDARYVNASGDTMTGGLLLVSTAHSPASIKTGLLLEIGGTASGVDLFAQKSLRSSGTLVVKGNALFQSTLTLNGVTYTFPYSDGTASGKVLKTDGAGHLSWSTDNTSAGGSSSFGSGNVVTIGDMRYVNTSGDTMTGGLLIQSGTLHGALPTPDAGVLLEIAGTASGRVLRAQDTLASSGVLTIRGATFLQSTIYARNLVSCGAITTTSSGALQCGAAAIGISQTSGDARYVLKQGDTMTGGLLIQSGTLHGALPVIDAGLLLEVAGTASGRTLRAMDTLASSGMLVVRNARSRFGTGALIYSSGGTVLALDSYRGATQIKAKPHLLFGYRGTFDTNLYRSTGATLRTDGSVEIYTATGHTALTIVSGAVSSAGTNLVELYSQVSTGFGTSYNNKVFRIDAAGTVYSDNSYNSTGADYAEWFYTSDRNLQPGDAVCIDLTRPNAVRKCDRSGDENVMGIVSGKPSFVGNTLTGAEGLPVPGTVLVGLIGQIAARAVVESGAAIRIGDALTPATLPGYVRKAGPGEANVGVALEALESGEGKVQVLIARRNGSLSAEAVDERVLQTVKDLKIEDELKIALQHTIDDLTNTGVFRQSVANVVTSQISELNVQSRIAQLEQQIAQLKGATVTSALLSRIAALESQVTLLASAPGTVVTTATGSAATGKDLSVKTLQTEDTLTVGKDARIAGDLYLDGILHAQDFNISGIMKVDGSLDVGTSLHAAALSIDSGATIGGTLTLKGNLDIAQGGQVTFATGSVLSVDSLIVRSGLQVLGPVTISGLAQFLGDVEVHGKLSVSDKQAGYATIHPTESSVAVSLQGYLSLPVVTASPDVPVLYGLKTTMTGFVIRLAAPATEDVTFSWFAVGVTGSGAQIIGTLSMNGNVAFPVDAKGYPVSSQAVWNACIRNHTILDDAGQPLSCARYHDGHIWHHPDLAMDFTFDSSHESPILILPEGYEAQTVEYNDITVPQGVLEDTSGVTGSSSSVSSVSSSAPSESSSVSSESNSASSVTQSSSSEATVSSEASTSSAEAVSSETPAAEPAPAEAPAAPAEETTPVTE